MAIEDFSISAVCNDGTGGNLLHYLEGDASREKMVGR